MGEVQSQIILLNGAGSSGKTTLARDLRQVLPVPYLHVSLDSFLGMARRSDLEAEGILFVNEPLPEMDGEPVLYNRIVSGFHHSIFALANAKLNLIVDHVLTRDESTLELLELLKDFRCLFVGVHCPLEEIEERERLRQDRPIGLARLHLQTVHERKVYDLEIDSCTESTESNVQAIGAKLYDLPYAGIAETILALKS